jgi:hypothetical protein
MVSHTNDEGRTLERELAELPGILKLISLVSVAILDVVFMLAVIIAGFFLLLYALATRTVLWSKDQKSAPDNTI